MFVGRNRELARLERLYESDTFQLVVVYGRRRVGKTSLVRKFGEGKPLLYFTALDQADQDNLRDFGGRVAEFFGLPGGTTFASWADAFDYLATQAAVRRFVLVFDEFPYAARRNLSIPSALQVCIDHHLSQTNLFLVLCGSDQGFMESDVLGRKSPLYGRRTAQMKLGPLGFRDAAKMLPDLGPQEQFRYYGCFGGVPYYLKQVDPGRTLRENAEELYFDPSGFLYDEPYGLLRQEFDEPAVYGSVLRAVAGGANRPKLMSDRTRVSQNTIPRYLRGLESLGIIERVVPFGENPETSKRAIYRICDACYDFWFTFVMPRSSDIEQGLGAVALRGISEEMLDGYLGRRFERLCAEWLSEQAVLGTLPLAASRIGSWWGTNPVRHERDDIDVLAANPQDKTLLIGECKYREGFDETAAIAALDSRRDLVKGYQTRWEYLFCKRPLSQGSETKLVSREDLICVTLEEMYG